MDVVLVGTIFLINLPTVPCLRFFRGKFKGLRVEVLCLLVITVYRIIILDDTVRNRSVSSTAIIICVNRKVFPSKWMVGLFDLFVSAAYFNIALPCSGVFQHGLGLTCFEGWDQVVRIRLNGSVFVEPACPVVNVISTVLVVVSNLSVGHILVIICSFGMNRCVGDVTVLRFTGLHIVPVSSAVGGILEFKLRFF